MAIEDASDAAPVTTADLIDWQNHLQGQVEALRTVVAELLSSRTQDAALVARIETALSGWVSAARAQPPTEPAIQAGFDAVHQQMAEALRPPDTH